MKILKVDLESFRRERRKSVRFNLVFFTMLAIAWPIFAVEVVNVNEPVMEDVTFRSYETEVHLDEEGTSRITETVQIDFSTPQTYVRAVGELSAIDSHVRFFSEPGEAFIDGEPVEVRQFYSGVGGNYYALGEELSGAHTVKFTYTVRNAVTYSKGKAYFRARLLPRYSFSSVENFTATMTIADLKPDSIKCWTTDEPKPGAAADNCDAEVTGEKVTVAIAEPGYLRPVRFVVELDNATAREDRLPWAGYWDNVLGRHWLTPALTALAALALALVLPRVRRRVRFRDNQWLGALTAAALLVALGLYFIGSFVPSILLLLPTAILWAAVPQYLRWSEQRLILTEDQVAELKHNSDKIEPHHRAEKS